MEGFYPSFWHLYRKSARHEEEWRRRNYALGKINIVPPPFLLYGLHSFYENSNSFVFEVAPKLGKNPSKMATSNHSIVCVITKLGLGEISLKNAVDDFPAGLYRKLSWGLQSTRLSNQSRLYRLITFIAFVVFFFQIITNLSLKIILNEKPLTAYNHSKVMVKGGIGFTHYSNVGGDRKEKKGHRGLRIPKRRLSLVFADGRKPFFLQG